MTDIRPLREIALDLVKEYTLAEIKEEVIRAALSKWNVQAACIRLGISRPTMYNLMERYGIPQSNPHTQRRLHLRSNPATPNLREKS